MGQILPGRTLHTMERRAYSQLVLCHETKWNSLFCLIVSHQIGIWMHFASFLLGIVNDNWDYFVCRNSGNGSPVGNGSPNETDKKRMRRAFQSKTFKVEMSFAAKIPMQAIAAALRGQESENSQEALRVLDIILRQHAAKQ
jgi:hypothetical protein